MHATQQVSEAAKRALAELRKSRPDVDESNLKVDIPVAQAPRPGDAPGTHGGVVWPGYVNPPRVDALAARMGLGIGGGPRMIAGVGGGMGAPNGQGVRVGNQFMFGAGQAHQFAAPAVGALLRPAMDLPARAREAAMPEPAMPIPLALARGRRVPVAPPPVRAQAQPVVAAGGGGRQRKSR